ncbi:hypothetical protein BMT54_09545 [Pasteurellaceae bacterium 15-036681]|nr:hypothetical protein BMT54_09545 [Pasteurellaceae bacterium 15-036681]
MKIKHYFLIIFWNFILIFSQSAVAAKRDFQCKVVGVSDGDTLTCLESKTQHKIRLLHIDAPESGQPYGSNAKKALSDIVFGKNVTIASTGNDRYGRVLGIVYYGNINANLRLVEQGMAWAYRPQTRAEYRFAQENARVRKIGLWQDKNAIEPLEWRKNGGKKPSLNTNSPPAAPTVSNAQCKIELSFDKLSISKLMGYFDCDWKQLIKDNIDHLDGGILVALFGLLFVPKSISSIRNMIRRKATNMAKRQVKKTIKSVTRPTRKRR